MIATLRILLGKTLAVIIVVAEYYGITIFEMMQVRAMQLGQLVGVRYAEAYTIKEHILIDDPLKMPVKSI